MPMRFDRWIRSKLFAITTFTPSSSVPFAAQSRELPSAVACAVALGGDVLGAIDFFPDIRRRAPAGTPPHAEARIIPYELRIRQMMEQALEQKKTIRAAAEALGMPKSTFADRAKAWGIAKPKK